MYTKCELRGFKRCAPRGCRLALPWTTAPPERILVRRLLYAFFDQVAEADEPTTWSSMPPSPKAMRK